MTDDEARDLSRHVPGVVVMAWWDGPQLRACAHSDRTIGYSIAEAGAMVGALLAAARNMAEQFAGAIGHAGPGEREAFERAMLQGMGSCEAHRGSTAVRMARRESPGGQDGSHGGEDDGTVAQG